MIDNMKAFYQQNKDFRRYIDECAKTYGKTVDYMLATRTAEEYYRSLQKGGCNEERGDDE